MIKQPRISILVTGSEILDGRVLDTNTQFIAGQLVSAGLLAHRTMTVTDNQEAILDALAVLQRDSDVIVVSGGLGPTTDDITRFAIAEFCGLPLKRDPATSDSLRAFFEKRGRVFSEINDRQALFPDPHVRIPNPVGTAPGFIASPANNPGLSIASLPGVPRELHAMFRDTVLPYIQEKFSVPSDIYTGFIRIFGLPESEVGAIVERCKLPESIFVSYRASFPEIHLKLVARGAAGREIIASASNSVRSAIGAGNIISESEGEGIEQVVYRLLSEKRATVSVAESCTGGLIGSMLTATPGSSACFLGGAIVYSNALKSELLGVEPKLITDFGAVSAPVADAMAVGAQARFKSDYALSVTGIAGPDGGSAEKPIGTFYIGIATPQGCRAQHFFYPATRERVRRYAAFCALTMLRNELVG